MPDTKTVTVTGAKIQVGDVIVADDDPIKPTRVLGTDNTIMASPGFRRYLVTDRGTKSVRVDHLYTVRRLP